MKTVTLAKNRETPLLRHSPWVFSGSVGKEEEGIQDGDTVSVADHRGNTLGFGHYQNGSIRVRILHFGPEAPSDDLFHDRLRSAVALRNDLGLGNDESTNAYRLVHAAADGLPGLIIDRYGPVAVLQCHSIGMYRQRQLIADALMEVCGEIDCVYDKSQGVLPVRTQADGADGVLAGTLPAELTVSENGVKFRIDPVGGQKTGFFLDQRDNRELVGQLSRGRRVLNLYCYTGGFSAYALRGGGAQVQSVDQSAAAVSLARTNVMLNGDFEDSHQGHEAEVMEYLKGVAPGIFDLVIVDPPAFAKNKHRRHKAVQAYKRLNARAMQAVAPGGLFFTFSCSRVVDRQLFRDTIVAAGLEAGRRARILRHLGQGPDHPVSLYHPEGEYLKGLMLRLD